MPKPKTTQTVRIRRTDLQAARIIATGALGRQPRNDAETLGVLVASCSDEALERLADRFNHDMRCGTVATAIHVAGVCAPDVEYTFNLRSGWGLTLEGGEVFPLGHASAPGVIEALAARGVELGQPADSTD